MYDKTKISIYQRKYTYFLLHSQKKTPLDALQRG